MIDFDIFDRDTYTRYSYTNGNVTYDAFFSSIYSKAPQTKTTLQKTTKISSPMRNYHRIDGYFRHKGWLERSPGDKFTLAEIETIILFDEL